MGNIKTGVLFLIMALMIISGFSIPAIADDSAKAPTFTLDDYNGNSHSLTDYQKSRAIVVMFIATRCPVSNAYNSRMESLYKKYKEQGVAFLGINSNKEESAEEVKKHAEENGLTFTILKDPDNKVADAYNAQVTPEVFILNPSLQILYHGRIDDSRRESDVKSRDAQNVLDAVLAGKPVPETETKAFGCTIKRIK